MHVGVLLFEEFETLDVFGPVEILGRLKGKFTVGFYSLSGGQIKNSHGVSIATKRFQETNQAIAIFLIPGGLGTRQEINNTLLIDTIRAVSETSQYVLTVCTGSALLAKSGLLDGRQATSNKRAFSWVTSTGEKVNWIKRARWTVDGKYYTSSGVSAGMDMTLGFLCDSYGIDFARQVAFHIEYNWTEDKEVDNFSEQ